MDDSRQRLLVIVVAAAIIVAVALPVYGYYRDNIASAHSVVSRVGDAEFDLGYLLKLSKSEARVAILGGAAAASDIQSIPFIVLEQLEAGQVVRQKGSELGVELTKEEVDAAIRDFILGAPAPDAPPLLESDYRQAFRDYLDTVELDEEDLRLRAEDILYVEKLQEIVGQEVPDVQEQIHVWFIATATEEEMSLVLARLEAGEDFVSLSKEYNTPVSELDLIGPSLDATSTAVISDDATSTAAAVEVEENEPGELGWIPRGVLTGVGDIVFELQPGEMSESFGGTSIYFVDERDPARPVDEAFLDVLRQQHFVEWFQEQREAIGVERCFEAPFVNADPDCSWQYEWLLERVL